MNPSAWACPRRIGFLFPHPCGRLSPIGCPECGNGQIADPYAERTDRGAYNDYDSYNEAEWQEAYAAEAAAGEPADFTEADGENLVRPEEDEFENDLGAS